MKKKVFFEEFDSLYYYHGASQNWHMTGLHFHNQYEIILFMSDGVELEIGNRIYKVKKGDIFFINNKEYHRTMGKEGETYSRYVLMFEPEIVMQLTQAFDYNFTALFEELKEDIVNRMHLSAQNLKLIERKMNQIEQSISGSMEIVNNKIQLKLNLLDLLNTLDMLFRSFVDVGRGEMFTETEISDDSLIPYRDRIEHIKKYIALHVEENLNLESIADYFYMNRYYLSHYFKKETGFTLMRYITNQKVMAAKKMLKGGMSVTDVAMRLSYNSDSHFISIFKKATGTTPKKYAQEINGNNV